MNVFSDDDLASKLHSQLSHVKIFCSELIIRTWNEKKISVEDRQNQIFKHFDVENIDFKEMAQIIEFILCLPGTNSSVERVFSEMNKTWTEDKSALSVETLKAVLMVKNNLKQSCVDFYNHLLSKPDLLKKIAGQEKYKPQTESTSKETNSNDTDDDVQSI